ncbi:MAG: hypothetical protein NTY53_14550 [Kiritimatiellaeota bacterium]|nr:hypothetical protein [Kiritimatiellota bacterium]
MKKSMWARLIAVTGIICVCACMAGCGSGFGRMTREEFRAKLVQNGIGRYPTDGQICGKKRFIAIMGKPDKTSVMDKKACWFYQCKDGTIQLVLEQSWLEHGADFRKSEEFKDGGVCIDMVNEL